MIDERLLTDEAYGFVSDPTPDRMHRPIVAMIDKISDEMRDVLEQMIIDGVDERYYVADYIHYLLHD